MIIANCDVIFRQYFSFTDLINIKKSYQNDTTFLYDYVKN